MSKALHFVSWTKTHVVSVHGTWCCWLACVAEVGWQAGRPDPPLMRLTKCRQLASWPWLLQFSSTRHLLAIMPRWLVH